MNIGKFAECVYRYLYVCYKPLQSDEVKCCFAVPAVSLRQTDGLRKKLMAYAVERYIKESAK